MLTNTTISPKFRLFSQASERWLKEKPFLLDYTPEPPAVKTNAIVEPNEISIEDIGGKEDEFSFEKNGFSIL